MTRKITTEGRGQGASDSGDPSVGAITLGQAGRLHDRAGGFHCSGDDDMWEAHLEIHHCNQETAAAPLICADLASASFSDSSWPLRARSSRTSLDTTAAATQSQGKMASYSIRYACYYLGASLKHSYLHACSQGRTTYSRIPLSESRYFL